MRSQYPKGLISFQLCVMALNDAPAEVDFHQKPVYQPSANSILAVQQP